MFTNTDSNLDINNVAAEHTRGPRWVVFLFILGPLLALLVGLPIALRGWISWLDVALAATTSPASCLSAAGSADGNTPAWTWIDIMDLGTDTVSLHYAIRIQRGTNLDAFLEGASQPDSDS